MSAHIDDVTSRDGAQSGRYAVNYDWLWTSPPGNDGSPATLRIELTPREAEAEARDDLALAIDRWFDSLERFDGGGRGFGGWAAEVDPNAGVIEVTSAGEDVADGIQAGADSVFDAIVARGDVDVRYVELPRS